MKSPFLLYSEDDKWHIYQTKNIGFLFLLPVLIAFLFPILAEIGPATDSYYWFVALFLVIGAFVGVNLGFLSLMLRQTAVFFRKKTILYRRTGGFNYEIRIEK